MSSELIKRPSTSKMHARTGGKVLVYMVVDIELVIIGIWFVDASVNLDVTRGQLIELVVMMVRQSRYQWIKIRRISMLELTTEWMDRCRMCCGVT